MRSNRIGCAISCLSQVFSVCNPSISIFVLSRSSIRVYRFEMLPELVSGMSLQWLSTMNFRAVTKYSFSKLYKLTTTAVSCFRSSITTMFIYCRAIALAPAKSVLPEPSFGKCSSCNTCAGIKRGFTSASNMASLTSRKANA